MLLTTAGKGIDPWVLFWSDIMLGSYTPAPKMIDLKDLDLVKKFVRDSIDESVSKVVKDHFFKELGTGWMIMQNRGLHPMPVATIMINGSDLMVSRSVPRYESDPVRISVADINFVDRIINVIIGKEP